MSTPTSRPLSNQDYSSDLQVGNVTANFGLGDFRPYGRDTSRDTSPK